MFSFYTPWKHQNTFGILVFSGGIIVNIDQRRVNHSSSLHEIF